MKLLIWGSQDYTDYNSFKRRVTAILKNTDKKHITIYDDGKKGVSKLARDYAAENKIDQTTLVPEWDKLGKQAGVMNDKNLAKTCTHAIVFFYHDDKDMNYKLGLLKEYNVKYRAIKIKRVITDAGSKKEDSQSLKK